ncbi:MAG: 5'/3'-nucleotidase SurE [Puniceicoccales bacterium]|nr:5'/3'-nucleotidase SurE [Puniceicoccales bacterium]
MASVLITNDDGINSAALMALASSFVSGGWDVFVAAPQEEQSGVGRSIGLNKDLSCDEVSLDGCRAWAIGGTPSDCVNVALGNLLPKKPDLIISGINWGLNITIPIILSSGTVGGAIEGFCWGIPSMAVSQGLPDQKEHYLQCKIDYLKHSGLMEAIKISADITVEISVKFIDRKVVELHNVNFPYNIKRSASVENTRLSDITLNKNADFNVYGSLYEPVGNKFVFKFPSVDLSDSSSAKGSDISCLAKGNVSDSLVDLKRLCAF